MFTGINSNTKLYRHIQNHLWVPDYNALFLRVKGVFHTTPEYRAWGKKVESAPIAHTLTIAILNWLTTIEFSVLEAEFNEHEIMELMMEEEDI